MTASLCVVCGRPTPDGYADVSCTGKAAAHGIVTAEHLGLKEDA